MRLCGHPAVTLSLQRRDIDRALVETLVSARERDREGIFQKEANHASLLFFFFFLLFLQKHLFTSLLLTGYSRGQKEGRWLQPPLPSKMAAGTCPVPSLTRTLRRAEAGGFPSAGLSFPAPARKDRLAPRPHRPAAARSSRGHGRESQRAQYLRPPPTPNPLEHRPVPSDA